MTFDIPSRAETEFRWRRGPRRQSVPPSFCQSGFLSVNSCQPGRGGSVAEKTRKSGAQEHFARRYPAPREL